MTELMQTLIAAPLGQGSVNGKSFEKLSDDRFLIDGEEFQLESAVTALVQHEPSTSGTGCVLMSGSKIIKAVVAKNRKQIGILLAEAKKKGYGLYTGQIIDRDGKRFVRRSTLAVDFSTFGGSQMTQAEVIAKESEEATKAVEDATKVEDDASETSDATAETEKKRSKKELKEEQKQQICQALFDAFNERGRLTILEIAEIHGGFFRTNPGFTMAFNHWLQPKGKIVAKKGPPKTSYYEIDDLS